MRVLTPSGFATRSTPSVAAEEKAIKAAVDAASEFGPVGKSFLTGNAALGGGGSTPASGVPVGSQSATSWNNTTGGLSNALIARVTQNLASSFERTTPEVEQALAEQGLSWGPPFPPGRPLDPFYGYRRPARTWDFQVGENVQLTPRWNRVSFQTLKALYEKYDVAQICLTPGVEIVTKRGLVAIEDVQVDDEVLTHKGRWRRVYKTMANPIGDRSAYRVAAGGLEPIVATGDHPILAARYTHTQSRRRVVRELDWVEAADLKARGEQKQAAWHYDAAVLPALAWDEVSDMLYLPDVLGEDFEDDEGQLVQSFHSCGRGTVLAKRTAGRLRKTPSSLRLDHRFGRLLGWYLAEGSQSHKRELKFSLSTNERTEAEQILADARAVLGATGSIKPTAHGSAINVCICSTVLARLFDCGTAKTKRVPEWAWHAPREFFEGMLSGWAQGDGCVSVRPDQPGYSPRTLVVTVSKTLAWHMRMVAIALGHKATLIDHLHVGRTSLIGGREVRSDRHYTVEWGTDPKRTGRYSFEEDGRILTTAIKTVEPADWDGLVYNIEVEQDHSYVTTGGTVHNCVRHLIDDVRSLDLNWLPPKNCKDDVSEDIQAAEEFWAYPDRRQPFDCWLAEWLQDVLRYDAGALFIRETEAGDPYSIEVVAGETIIPLIDYYGRRPEDEEPEADPDGETEGHITPAYLQIIKGMPWDWMTADQLVYQPLWPLPESQYGQCPLESVLLSANTDLRFQWHFLQYFTDGSLPAGFMEAPPDMSDPAQIQQWQEYWDAVMLGDQAKLNQIRFVPSGSKFTPAKAAAEKFDETFPLYLMRRMCAAYKVTPTDLGFTETVNRASSEIQVDVQKRVGRGPIVQYIEGVVNLITTQRLGLRARLQIEKSDEVEDLVAVAQAHGIYIDHAVESVDEVREELGKPVDKSRPAPRYINNTRAGPIPLLALESQAGEIDSETYGRADTQQLVSTPYASPPGALPPQGSPEQKAAAETTAQASRDLIEATTGQKPPAVEPEAGTPGGAPPTPPGDAGEEEAGKAVGWREVLHLLDLMEKGRSRSAFIKAVEQVHSGAAKCYSPAFDDELIETPAGPKYVQMVYDLPPGDDCLKSVVAVSDEQGGEAEYLFGSDCIAPIDGPFIETSPNVFESVDKAEATAGITVATGVQGVDLKGATDDDDEEEDEVSKATEMALEVRRWRENARNRLRKGKSPVGPFTSVVLPADMQQQLRQALKTATTTGEVDAVFAGLGKPSAGERPAFHSQADRITGHYSGQIAASLAKLYTNQQILDAIQAAKDALPDLTPAEKAAVWDKSAPELTLRELAYRDRLKSSLLKDAQLDLGFQAARQALEANKPDVGALRTVLGSLYGDGLLQGAHDAAQASGGTIVASLKDVEAAAPKSYWNEWEPGYGDAAAQAADGGMRTMLDQAGIRIQGITESATDRIGNTISQGLANGDSVDTVAKAVQDEISSPARAEVIATTEYARAMDTASVQTYEQAGIAEEDWLAEPDACPECEANAEGSPYPVGEGPSVPQHPRCRCSKAPHIAE